MRKKLFLGLLLTVALPLYAQIGTDQPDSLRLHPKPENEALQGSPLLDTDKAWMDFDFTLPTVPQLPKAKIYLTLFPYTGSTPFNWDPIYQRKIKVGKNTWRGNPLYEIESFRAYSNWAKSPLDKGLRKSRDEIEFSGMRYTTTERANNMAVSSWTSTSGPSGIDLMTIFTKDFWNVKGRKRRARTLEVLKAYGDSTLLPSKKKETENHE
jgi:hypothetical protein